MTKHYNVPRALRYGGEHPLTVPPMSPPADELPSPTPPLPLALKVVDDDPTTDTDKENPMSRKPPTDDGESILAALDNDPVGALLAWEDQARAEALVFGYDEPRPGTIRRPRQIVFVGSTGRGIR